MDRSAHCFPTRKVLASLAAALLTLPAGAGEQPVPKAAPLPAARLWPAPALPPLQLILGPSEGRATPNRTNSAYAAGGNINVSQPNPTTIVVLMSGLVAAKGDTCFKDAVASYQFDLHQDFQVVLNSPDVKSVKLSLEGRALGRLRSYCERPSFCKKAGTAEITTPGSAAIASGTAEMVAVHLPAHSICCCENETVYNQEGPSSVPVAPGQYTLHQVFGISASGPGGPLLVRSASADFTPDLTLDVRQLGITEPVVGIANRDFGFQVTIKLIPE